MRGAAEPNIGDVHDRPPFGRADKRSSLDYGGCPYDLDRLQESCDSTAQPLEAQPKSCSASVGEGGGGAGFMVIFTSDVSTFPLALVTMTQTRGERRDVTAGLHLAFGAGQNVILEAEQSNLGLLI